MNNPLLTADEFLDAEGIEFTDKEHHDFIGSSIAVAAFLDVQPDDSGRYPYRIWVAALIKEE